VRVAKNTELVKQMLRDAAAHLEGWTLAEIEEAAEEECEQPETSQMVPAMLYAAAESKR
jgi:hypothetical protein